MALQDILQGFGNPAAQRAAILQRLNIDPNRASGYGGNTQFDQAMNDLYRQGLQSSTQLDTQEGDLNRGYEKNLAQAAVDRDKALQAIKGNFAQRGMSFSGAQVDELGSANSDFDRYLANLASDKQAGIGSIGRNRLNLEEGLTRGRMSAEEGYGNDLSGFLQQQAIDLWNTNYNQALQQQAAQQQRPAPAAPRSSSPRPAPSYAPAAQYAPTPAPRPAHTSTYTGDYVKPDLVVNRTPAPVKKPLTPLRGKF